MSDAKKVLIWVGVGLTGAFGAVLVTIAAIFVVPVALFGALSWWMLDEHFERVDRMIDHHEQQVERMHDQRAPARAEFRARQQEMREDFERARVEASVDRASSEASFLTRYTATEASIDEQRTRMERDRALWFD